MDAHLLGNNNRQVFSQSYTTETKSCSFSVQNKGLLHFFTFYLQAVKRYQSYFIKAYTHVHMATVTQQQTPQIPI